MVEGDEPPWTKEMGCPSIQPIQVHGPDLHIFHELVLNTYTTQSVKQHYSEAIEELGTVRACTRSKKTYNDRSCV